jgi:hypothetical protein
MSRHAGAVPDRRASIGDQLAASPRCEPLEAKIQAQLTAWSRTLEPRRQTVELVEASANTLVGRLHGAIQTQLGDLRPLIGDLRDRAEKAEKEAKRLAREWQAKREPARAALDELKTGEEKASGELKAALDSAITEFRKPS